MKLLQQDVRDPSDCAPDAICAYNFSYFTFWTRQSLQRYFESVRNSIAQDGLFFLDIFGGCDAHEPDTEVTEFDGFEFHWELAEFDPISHRVVFHIHFQPDQGEPMHRAFTYDWRYWTIPEIRELLAAAGFRDSRVYWQQSDDVTDEFNGEFRHQRIAINESGWLAYIVAIP